jgi:hypothetical protein
MENKRSTGVESTKRVRAHVCAFTLKSSHPPSSSSVSARSQRPFGLVKFPGFWKLWIMLGQLEERQAGAQHCTVPLLTSTSAVSITELRTPAQILWGVKTHSVLQWSMTQEIPRGSLRTTTTEHDLPLGCMLMLVQTCGPRSQRPSWQGNTEAARAAYNKGTRRCHASAGEFLRTGTSPTFIPLLLRSSV